MLRLIVAMAVCVPIQAQAADRYTCKDVRDAAAQMGRDRLEAIAVAAGISEQDKARARACLEGRHKRHQP